MPRKQATTLTEIAEAALDHISSHGLKQTQMSDIAKRLGISVGTLYLYVENKEALLALASTLLLTPENLEDTSLPYKSVPREQLAQLFIEVASEWARWPTLNQAIKDKSTDLETFRAIGFELYDLIAAHRHAIWFLDQLAAELPEIAPIHLNNVRGRTISDLTSLLIASGQSSINPDGLALMARVSLEQISWSAMHRHRAGLDAQPTGNLTEDDIRDLAIHAFSSTLQAALR
jgi:AcrR family transcriptional regulator